MNTHETRFSKLLYLERRRLRHKRVLTKTGQIVLYVAAITLAVAIITGVGHFRQMPW